MGKLAIPGQELTIRRDDREAEGARLEIVCAVTGTEGSNPSLSATHFVQNQAAFT